MARRYVEDHPLVLCLEIDALRVTLGRWQDHDESKLLARGLALALAETHLRAGHDVIVPQYLGHTDFIDALDDLARTLSVRFVETLLMDTESAVNERFQVRRAELSAAGRAHPQADLAEPAVGAVIAESFDRLQAVMAARPRTHVIAMTDGLEAGHQALREAVNAELAD
jgi:hypothetical protein